MALGLLVSTLGIVVFSSLGLPAGAASVLVGLALLPFFATVVVNAMRFRRDVMQQAGAAMYRTLPLWLRLVPPLFLVGSVAAAKVLQRAEAPAGSRVAVLALGFLGFALGLRELHGRATRRAGNDE